MKKRKFRIEIQKTYIATDEVIIEATSLKEAEAKAKKISESTDYSKQLRLDATLITKLNKGD